MGPGTACLLKVNPFDYLRDVLTRIAATPVSQLDQFLPDRWEPAHTNGVT